MNKNSSGYSGGLGEWRDWPTAEKARLLKRLRQTQTPSLIDSQRVQQPVPPFPEWLHTVTPTFRWDWLYLQYIQQHLDKVTSGEIDRLMIFLPPRHGKCLAAGSRVLMADGRLLPIEDVRRSDTVISLNSAGFSCSGDVKHLMQNGERTVLKITLISGRELVCTENHPLLTMLGWQKAALLAVGDAVATLANGHGDYPQWKRIVSIEPDGIRETFDLEVANTHNFVAEGIVVHNSEMVTVRYPVWRLEQDPEMRIIVGAYNLDFAAYFSRKAKRIAETRMELAHDRQATVDWETIVGGGMRAAGVGSGITGRGGNLIIIDDPIKSRKEANSRAYREAVYNWYKDDLYTRLEPNGAIVLINTRWHENDLSGRLLEEDPGEWTVISLPALAGDDDPLGRAPGAALCPERYDEAALARIQRTLGLSFYALYQQTPMPPEGDFFKRYWFEIVPVAPAPGRAWWVRYWDKASGQDEGDYTVGVLMALSKDTGELFVVDVQRGQWESDARDAVIRQTLALDEQAYGEHLVTWFEQEGGSSGKDAARATVKAFVGHRVFAESVSRAGDKATRAEPFQAQAMVKNVKLINGPWNKAYLEELAAFPFGANDDQVDASSGALRRLTIIQEREQRQGASEAPKTGKPRYVRTGLTG